MGIWGTRIRISIRIVAHDSETIYAKDAHIADDCLLKLNIRTWAFVQTGSQTEQRK